MTFVGSFADVARRLSVKCDQTTQTQKQISIRALNYLTHVLYI